MGLWSFLFGRKNQVVQKVVEAQVKFLYTHIEHDAFSFEDQEFIMDLHSRKVHSFTRYEKNMINRLVGRVIKRAHEID